MQELLPTPMEPCFQPRVTLNDALARRSVDVLLVQPPLTMRIRYDQQNSVVKSYFDALLGGSAGLLGDDPFEPNNGLLFLASDLRLSGVRVHLLDLHVLDLLHRRRTGEPLGDAAIADILSAFDYRVLAISLIAIAEEQGAILARTSKRLHPTVPVVVGGLLPSALPADMAVRHPEFDEIVIGDGLRRILALLGNRFPIPQPQRATRRAFDLVVQDIPMIPRITTTLGCPARCAFCSPIRMQHPPRYADDAARGMAVAACREVEELRDVYNVTFFVLGNLSALSPKQEADAEFCRLLYKRRVGVPFWAQMRPDDVSGETARLLRSAGCIQVAIGIETASASSLKLSGKRYRLRSGNDGQSVAMSLRMLKDEGLGTYGYFIIGMPGETPDDVKLTVELMDNLMAQELLDGTHISVPVPYPGTPWFAAPHDFGISIEHSRFSEYWMNCDPLGYGPPVISTRSIAAAELYTLWLEALSVATQRYRTRRSGGRDAITRLFNTATSRQAAQC